VETLTPIRLRYTGEVIDLTTAYDDQDIIHTEPVHWSAQFINTTVGRAILNDHLARGHAVHQRLAQEEGHRRSW
jgi:DNA-directed RNA polymerase subunit beta'